MDIPIVPLQVQMSSEQLCPFCGTQLFEATMATFLSHLRLFHADEFCWFLTQKG